MEVGDSGGGGGLSVRRRKVEVTVVAVLVVLVVVVVLVRRHHDAAIKVDPEAYALCTVVKAAAVAGSAPPSVVLNPSDALVHSGKYHQLAQDVLGLRSASYDSGISSAAAAADSQTVLADCESDGQASALNGS